MHSPSEIMGLMIAMHSSSEQYAASIALLKIEWVRMACNQSCTMRTDTIQLILNYSKTWTFSSVTLGTLFNYR